MGAKPGQVTAETAAGDPGGHGDQGNLRRHQTQEDVRLPALVELWPPGEFPDPLGHHRQGEQGHQHRRKAQDRSGSQGGHTRLGLTRGSRA